MAVRYISSRGIETLVPGIQNLRGVNQLLVSFNSIIDTDFGLLLYIRKHFMNSKLFDPSFFEAHKQINLMVKALLDREDINPLYLCMNKNKDDWKESADALYNSLILNEDHYKKILQLSMPTAVLDFIQLCIANKDEIKPTILCENPEEIVTIHKGVSQIIPIQLMTNTEDISEYQLFFLKHHNDSYAQFIEKGISDNKSIYLANYKFNSIPNILADSAIKKIGIRFNQLGRFDIYNREKLNIKEEE